MKTKTILMVVIAPGMPVQVRETDGSLEALQRCVEGPIETVRWKSRFKMYANEMGLLRGFSPNARVSAKLDPRLYPDGVVGPVVVYKVRGMTPEEAAKVVTEFS